MFDRPACHPPIMAKPRNPLIIKAKPICTPSDQEYQHKSNAGKADLYTAYWILPAEPGIWLFSRLNAAREKVIAVDLSTVMLERARKKFEKKDLLEFYRPVCGDGERLPLGDHSVDAVMTAFGIRNMTDTGKALDEITRVLSGSGILVILEFSKPGIAVFRHLFQIYFKFILPRIGTWLSGHDSAYYYLPRSVDEFPDPPVFKTMLEKKGFSDIRSFPMMFGVVTVYCGIKL